MNILEVQEWVESLFENETFILGVFSAPRIKEETQKISIRPVTLKTELHYQVTEFRDNKAFHQNLPKEECAAWMTGLFDKYAHATFFTLEADFYLSSHLQENQWRVKIKRQPPSKSQVESTPNRKKEPILTEGTPIPFLVELGVMNDVGRVYPKKSDKFRQINRFLEMVRDVLPSIHPKKPVHIVDVGCGKAYLTFALYSFLHHSLGYDVHITGLDVKADVVATCQAVAKKLGLNGMHFIQGDVRNYHPETTVEMLVALHACDTATDVALEKGIKWNAQVILAAPCCQHQLLTQIQHPDLEPLLQYGLLKERFSALVTDAARAQLLESCGYQTQILEFIDFEHTPKNILIRAIKTKSDNKQAKDMYLAFKKALHIARTMNDE